MRERDRGKDREGKTERFIHQRFKIFDRGDSNEYTQHTVFKKKENYPKSAALRFFPKDSRTSSKQPW